MNLRSAAFETRELQAAAFAQGEPFVQTEILRRKLARRRIGDGHAEIGQRSRFQRTPSWPPQADQDCADAFASASCALSMTPAEAAGTMAAAIIRANA